MDGIERKNWKFMQCFGDKNESALVNEADIITALEFNHDGNYLASGDKGGRLVVFKRSENNSQCDYQFYAEIQSHECEFDYLKSIVIDEKINKLKWCQPQNDTQYLLATNGTPIEKNIKLWKISEKQSQIVVKNNASALRESLSNINSSSTTLLPGLPVAQSDDPIVHTGLKHVFSNAHMYHINSISTNVDGELFLSSDDLRINVWNMHVPTLSYNILDLKPVLFESISETITTAEFHPTDPNTFLYATSKGIVNVADMRARAVIHQPSLQFANKYAQKNALIDLIENITAAKFSPDGKFIVCRDFLNLVVWDVSMPSEPLRRFPIHEYLMPRLGDLLDSESIYDRFDFCMNRTGSQIMAGTYGNSFFIYDTINSTMQPFEANRASLKRRQIRGEIITQTFSLEKPTGTTPASRLVDRSMNGVDSLFTSTGFPNSNMFATDRKVMNAAWHPTENTLAVGATNMLYIFNQNGLSSSRNLAK